MVIGTILKGLTGIFKCPAIPVICTIVEFVQGKRTGMPTAFSLGLSDLIDLDLIDCGFEVVQSPPKNLTHLSLKIAESIMEVGLDELTINYVFLEKKSRIYMPIVSIIDMSSGNPILDSVWKVKKGQIKVLFNTDFSTKSDTKNLLFNLADRYIYNCNNYGCPGHILLGEKCKKSSDPLSSYMIPKPDPFKLKPNPFELKPDPFERMKKHYCREIGCPGHILLGEKCKKSSDPF